MRDIFTALALMWCLYNTWNIHHNFKQDRIANSIDAITSTVMKSQEKRVSKLEKEMKNVSEILMIYFDVSSKIVDKIVKMGEENSYERDVLKMGSKDDKEG